MTFRKGQKISPSKKKKKNERKITFKVKSLFLGTIKLKYCNGSTVLLLYFDEIFSLNLDFYKCHHDY